MELRDNDGCTAAAVHPDGPAKKPVAARGCADQLVYVTTSKTCDTSRLTRYGSSRMSSNPDDEQRVFSHNMVCARRQRLKVVVVSRARERARRV